MSKQTGCILCYGIYEYLLICFLKASVLLHKEYYAHYPKTMMILIKNSQRNVWMDIYIPRSKFDV